MAASVGGDREKSTFFHLRTSGLLQKWQLIIGASTRRSGFIALVHITLVF